MKKTDTLVFSLHQDDWNDFVDWIYNNEKDNRSTTVIPKDIYLRLGFTPLHIKASENIFNWLKLRVVMKYKTLKDALKESTWFVVCLDGLEEEAVCCVSEAASSLPVNGTTDEFWSTLLIKIKDRIQEREGGKSYTVTV